MLLEDGLTRRRAERRHAAQHLIEDGGERIDVRLVGHRRLTDLLGREVLRRRLRGNDGLHRFRVAQAGQLHVHQLDASVLEHHHVAGAERAVDEAHAVKRLHGSPEVERQAERGADGELDDRRRRRLQSHQLRPVTFRIRPSSRYTRGTCSSLPHDGQVASPSSKHSSHATQTARPRSGIGTRERERTAALIIVLKPLREGSTQREYQNRKRAGTSCAERLLLARPTSRAGSSARLRTTPDGLALVTLYWKSMAE